MCSNTGSSTCGCGSSGGNGVIMWSSGLKKQPHQQQQQKRPRVPKRGPGVAELEKILREQETIDITTTTATAAITTTTTDTRGIVEGFSSACFINNYPPSSFKSHLSSHQHHQHPLPHQPHQRPSSPPSGRISVPSHGVSSRNLPSHATLAPKFDNLGRNGTGSGFVQEQDLFPLNLNLNSCKSKSDSDSGNSGESNPVWPYPNATVQKRNNPYPSPTMNQFLGTGNPASSGSLSIGLHTQLEPPSNQSSYYHYKSKAPEEHKMAGMKRVHTSSLDNSLIPPSNFQVLPSFSRYNRPHQSSTNDSHGVTNYNSTNECYRDAKWGSTLELSSRKFNSDTVGHGHANFPPFVTPEVPPPPMHLFQGVLSKGNVFLSQVTQDKIEDSFQRTESSGPERKPFYNFLKVNDQDGVTEAMLGSNPGGREVGRGGIDLSLKL